MTLPKSLAAYPDCEAHFGKALAAPRGIGVTLESRGAATAYMQKLNTYRTMLRKQSKGVYPPEHPQYGRSAYDAIKVAKDPENDCRLLLQPYSVKIVKEEEL